MSYRSRESRRRKRQAIAAAKREHRETIASRYYVTPVKRECRCSSCGAKLRLKANMVYRHNGRVTLCLPCADRDPLVDYRVSLRWERARQRRKKALARRDEPHLLAFDVAG